MDPNTLAVVGLAVAVAAAVVVHKVAKDKGYDPGGWTMAALLAWPVALLMILLKPRNPRMFRRCPDCGSGDVPFDAPVCRHCGRDERTVVRA